ncbi:MAG TPA: response regulator transcription factor [Planctomycetaceae bacterium]|nr:response regulator transcription factor [Planctomycetaceae bacterium]
MNETIRLLVIDDQEIFRLGLRVGLNEFDDICLDCEAEDGPAGLALIAERRPDVAVVDIWLPGMDGVEVAARIPEISPETRIILISGFFDDAAIAKGLELGVDGIITKTDSPKQFARFIRLVHSGVFCCSPSIAENPFVRLPDQATRARRVRS